MSARWSAGFVIGLPIACAAWTAVVSLTVYLWRTSTAEREYGMINDRRMFARIVLGIAVVLSLSLPWAFFPWSAQYHRWVPKAGVVDVVGARFTSNTSGDTSGAISSYVVQFHGDPTRYDCWDNRCALAHPGDWLTLSCIRHFVWSGVPGWDCNYVKDEQS